MATSSDSEWTTSDEEETEITNENKIETIKNYPADIKYDSVVLNVALHPTKDVLAAGDIEGNVYLHSYSSESSNQQLFTLNCHKKSIRSLAFSSQGDKLFSVSKDLSMKVTDLNEGRKKHKIKKAHDSAINCLQIVNDNIAATGDDDGMVKLWDTRTWRSVMEVKEMDDYVSCMTVNEENKVLLATSGDGTLSAFNIRRCKLDVQSELNESELLAVAIVKDGRKVVVGNGDGEIDIYNYGEWGVRNDRFVGHPDSVSVIVPVSANMICTGCNDGKVRAVSILPNRFVGVVGSHPGGFPVMSMDISRDGDLIASCSQDETVKFWNVSDLRTLEVDGTTRTHRKTVEKPLATSRDREDFFEDMD